MGPEVLFLEEAIKEFTKAKNVISCANGTDALTLPLMAWELTNKDAVFVPSFTYVASAEAPAQIGAVPFLIDVCPKTFNVDVNSLKQGIIDAKKIGLNPSVLIAVDLFGQVADIEELSEVCNDNNIKIICDSAQSFGASQNKIKVGNFGDVTTTSFFPAKPLGCYGDGGAVITNNDELAEVIKSIRLHGKGEFKYDNIRIGLNSRLDTIQAAILLEKLKIFPKEIELRNNIAKLYSEELKDFIQTPFIKQNNISTWAQYTLQSDNRESYINNLKKNNIPTVIYYPKPLHVQEGYKHFPKVSKGLPNSDILSKRVFSIPMHPYIKRDQVDRICNSLKTISIKE